MGEEGFSNNDVLSRPCIADVSFLNNFIHSEGASLLELLLGQAVHLSPTVLDVHETLPELPKAKPASEFLKPLYASRSRGHPGHEEMVRLVRSFALGVEKLWVPVEPSGDELVLASRLSSKSLRAKARDAYPELSRRRVELDPKEAEVAAIAINRGWTLLTEDQASVELLGCLYPNIPLRGICPLLVQAAEQGLLTCEEAAELFNRRIVDELGLWATRGSGSKRQRLWLRCDPARSSWES